MRPRSLALASLAILALIIPGCNPAGPAGLKIGLVTDVGTLNDKNFNQYSWEGAQDGATKVGGTATSAVSTTSDDIGRNIQSFVDQKFDIIVTVGFAAGSDTIKAAHANPTIKFIGVDQSFICIDENGLPDTTPADDPSTPAKESPDCNGDPATLLPNYQGIGWKEQQPGYLAGIVAGALSTSGVIAAVGGTWAVPAVPNYIVGYANGAKSVNPNIQVVVQYVSPQADAAAFADAAGGKAFASQLLASNPTVDVIFQVAGLTGNGVLQAACEKGLKAIGVDVDQYVSAPDTKACTIVSAEKKLKKNVSDAIVRIKNGTAKGGPNVLDITTDDVGLSSFHEFANLITADTQAKIDAAIAAMKAGTLQPCVLNNFGGCATGDQGALPQ
ncbi:MAG: BMP family ABC transporter substrate-binding protein [Aeromicrobium sp.]